MRVRRASPIALACSLVAHAAAIPSFFEDAWNSGAWSLQTVAGQAGGQFGTRVATEGVGGFNDPHWRVITQTNASTTSFSGRSFIVNPAYPGELQAVQFQVNYRNELSFGQGMGFALGVRRFGQTFMGPVTATGTALSTWNANFPSVLVASDFTRIPDGVRNLTFSGADSMEFGLITFNSGGELIAVSFDRFSLQFFGSYHGRFSIAGRPLPMPPGMVRIKVYQGSNFIEEIDTAHTPDGTFTFSPSVTGTVRLVIKADPGLAITRTVTLGSSPLFDQTGVMPNGDVDGSNEVDLSDFLILAAYYEASPLLVPQVDLNADGACDLSDFLILASNYERVGDR